MFDNYSDVVTVKELCQMFKIGKNAAYTLLNDRNIASIRIRRRFLIPKSYILDYISVRQTLQNEETDV